MDIWEDPEQQMAANTVLAQVRNTYAINILRRVKSKLEGKDFDHVTKMSVEEQVDKIIKQATDIDNLCVMYEGWTPWI
ncbi:1491_t:CDS:2 [Ambispora leptoticha]|uniref:1491_t:CDS:1 n=1 Tax=Ambispora leptoticha TaxID=144679 RepID=A0A9N9B1C8_9GLOM|nr:1491_t:CDS:2 [Ambispora leptoticha]